MFTTFWSAVAPGSMVGSKLNALSAATRATCAARSPWSLLSTWSLSVGLDVLPLGSPEEDDDDVLCEDDEHAKVAVAKSRASPSDVHLRRIVSSVPVVAAERQCAALGYGAVLP